MSYTSLTMSFSAGVLALSLGGCADLAGRASGVEKQAVAGVPQMRTTAVVVDPCNSVGIDARPARDVSQLEINQNLSAGRQVTHHRGWVLFSKESLATKFGPLAGGLAGGILLSGIGAGTGKLIAITAGTIGGAVGGERVGKNARVEDLVDLAACRDYLNKTSFEGVAPQPSLIDMNRRSDRPINTIPRGVEATQGSIQPIAP